VNLGSRESLDVSLYKYLDDHRENNPGNPLNFERSDYDSRREGYGVKNFSRTNSISNLRGYSNDQSSNLRDKGRFTSPIEYNMNSFGGTYRKVAAPEMYKVGDRGQTF
jgi:hypothetical protein